MQNVVSTIMYSMTTYSMILYVVTCVLESSLEGYQPTRYWAVSRAGTRMGKWGRSLGCTI